MSERPIIMSAPMVRATIREIEMPGTGKTQTRRIIKAKPYNKDGDKVNISIAKSASYVQGADGRFYYAFEHPLGGPLTAYVAHFHIGDCLWVRETCRAEELCDGRAGVRYLADDAWLPISPTPEASDAWLTLYHYRTGTTRKRGQTVPPIHAPRWASRIILTVTEVRVERLQAITDADAIDEGIEPHIRGGWNWREVSPDDEDQSAFKTAVLAFEDLWDSIHGEGAWLTNPWVAAVRFCPESRLAPVSRDEGERT